MLRRLLFVLAFVLMTTPAVAQENISWDVLAQVKLVKTDAGKYVPEFQEPVQALSTQQVALKGFMLPLDQSPKQQHFILSANPVANCFYCLPGGPESLIEVKLDEAVDFSYDPITISGTLELLADDPMGMYYRLNNAKVESD